MDPNYYHDMCIEKILKLLGRFRKLDAKELSELTGLTLENINDGIDYLMNLGAVKLKGKSPPFNFKYVTITKDRMKLISKKIFYR